MNPKIASAGGTIFLHHVTLLANILLSKNVFPIFSGTEFLGYFIPSFFVKLYQMLLYSRPRAERPLVIDESLKVLSS